MMTNPAVCGKCLGFVVAREWTEPDLFGGVRIVVAHECITCGYVAIVSTVDVAASLA